MDSFDYNKISSLFENINRTHPFNLEKKTFKIPFDFHFLVGVPFTIKGPLHVKSIGADNFKRPDYFISFFQQTLNVVFLKKESNQCIYEKCSNFNYKQFSLMKDDPIILKFFFFFLYFLLEETTKFGIHITKVEKEFKKALAFDPYFTGFFTLDLLLRISYLFLDLDFDDVRNSAKNKYKRCIIEDFFSCFFQLNPITLKEKQDPDFYMQFPEVRLLIEEESNTWVPFYDNPYNVLEYKVKKEGENYYLEGHTFAKEYFNGVPLENNSLIKKEAERFLRAPLEKNALLVTLPPVLVSLYINSFQEAFNYLGFYDSFDPSYFDTEKIKESVFSKLTFHSMQDMDTAFWGQVVFDFMFNHFPYIYPQLALLKKESEIESFIEDIKKNNPPYETGSLLQTYLQGCDFFPSFYSVAECLKTYREERIKEDCDNIKKTYSKFLREVEPFESYFSPKKEDYIDFEEDYEKITRAVGIIK